MALSNAHLDSTDGFYSRTVHRPVARYLLKFVPLFVSGNMVTTLSLLVGIGAACALLAGSALATVVLIQTYCILSCLDGEVARLRRAASTKGDFYDTLTDRFVEVVVLFTIIRSFGADHMPQDIAWFAPYVSLTLVYLLAYSSEKYRSAFKVGFPKPREGIFNLVSSGIDARMTAYCVILGVGALAGSDAGYKLFIALMSVEFANIALRFILVARS